MFSCCKPSFTNHKRNRIIPSIEVEDGKRLSSNPQQPAISASAPLTRINEDEESLPKDVKRAKNDGFHIDHKSNSDPFSLFLPQDDSQRVRVFSNSVAGTSSSPCNSDNSAIDTHTHIPGSSLVKSFSTNFLVHKETAPNPANDKQLSIYIVTWNMNGKIPSHDQLQAIRNLIDPSTSLSNTPDIIAIATQECERPLSQSWYIPPTSSSTCPQWSSFLDSTLQPKYTKISSLSLCSTHLSLYINSTTSSLVSNVQHDKVILGPGNLVGTKGSVAISFTIQHNNNNNIRNPSTPASFCFVNSHLKAGEDKESSKVRAMQFEKIQAGLLEIKGSSGRDAGFARMSDRVDYCFFVGDLNTRLTTMDRTTAMSIISTSPSSSVPSLTKSKSLLASDELALLLNRSTALRGFKEGQISFLPTFKFNTDSDIYDTSNKQRIPAYTDRILFSSRTLLSRPFSARTLFQFGKKGDARGLRCLLYTNQPQIKCSDHKPVVGLYTVNL